VNISASSLTPVFVPSDCEAGVKLRLMLRSAEQICERRLHPFERPVGVLRRGEIVRVHRERDRQ
jgi:hypothetical protein